MSTVIGLTGGIGSGKSAVARLFEEAGVSVIDTDAIAHELTQPGGAAMELIRAEFGPSFIDQSGALDRAKMRALAFADSEARGRLERILHPLIRNAADQRAAAATSPYVIMMVPLLVEGGIDRNRYQRVLVVDCPEETQVARVRLRSGLEEQQVRHIIASQVPRRARIEAADDVVDNTGTLEQLRPQVERLHALYIALCTRPLQAGGLANGHSIGRESNHPAKPNPLEAPLIVYEYPLNERIRTLMRLEDLFERARYFLGKQEAMEHHMAIRTLFEILEVASRADLKSDLLQELERQKKVLLSFRNNPEIAEDLLAQIVGDMERAAQALFAMTGKIGQYLRENEWLMSIKQRTGIPGGACQFDLPSYHYWLHRDPAARIADLVSWAAPLYPIRDGTAIVLRILREGGKPVRMIAHQGAFSQMLGGKVAQMVRIRLPHDAQTIPEISANKYALNVRFTVFGAEARPKMCESDVEFELSFCNL